MLLTTAADTLTSILTVATGTEAAMLVVSLEPDLHRTAEPRVRRRTAGVEQPCYRCLAIGQVTFAQYSATESLSEKELSGISLLWCLSRV